MVLDGNTKSFKLDYVLVLLTQQLPPPPPQVRFSSLLMLMEVASKLKENYMVLLPETIPFLAELMEGEAHTQTHINCWL